MQLTLSRALRYKKRVIEKICNIESDIQTYNSIIEGTEVEVDVNELLKQRTDLKRYLINFKLTVQEATRPIQKEILELAEAKSDISFYKRLPTDHGKQVMQPRYGMTEATENTFVATIRKDEKERVISQLQDKIDELQTTIDAHNANTTITVDNVL